jgi:hypothetical protein
MERNKKEAHQKLVKILKLVVSCLNRHLLRIHVSGEVCDDNIYILMP